MEHFSGGYLQRVKPLDELLLLLLLTKHAGHVLFQAGDDVSVHLWKYHCNLHCDDYSIRCSGLTHFQIWSAFVQYFG